MTGTVWPSHVALAFDLNGTSTRSSTGSASMSARKRDHAAGLAALQDADHAGDADAGLHLDAELLEMLGGERRGARLLVGELGMLVDVAPPGDDLVLDLQGGVGDALGELVGGRLSCPCLSVLDQGLRGKD